MYRRNFVILLILLPFATIAQKLVVKLELPEEIGYLEPINLKYSFLYKGEEAININSPYYSWDVYIRREDHDAECLIYSGGGTFLLVGKPFLT